MNQRQNLDNYKIISSKLHILLPDFSETLIRVGKANDGGYIIPEKILGEIELLVSCGISDDWSFEQDLQTRNPKIEIHAFDHTTSSVFFLLNFFKKLIGALLRILSFSEVRNPFKILQEYRTFFGENTLNTHYKKMILGRNLGKNQLNLSEVMSLSNKRPIMLKMDIEGSEYSLIEEILNFESQISCLVIEFHETDKRRDEFLKSIDSLRKYFGICHIHGNNFAGMASDNLPIVVEMTFINKRISYKKELKRVFPILNLDQPNNPMREDFALKFEEV